MIPLRAAAAMAVALTLVACGTTPARSLSAGHPLATPTPAAAATPSPSPTTTPEPTRYPASAVRVVVNGVERSPGGGIFVDGLGGTTIEVTFPFAVDRASVDSWLPRGGSPTWTDERTLRLSFAENELVLAFKIPQARSADGRSSLDLLVVNVSYTPSTVLSVYTVAGALAAGGPKASASWRIPTSARSPDRYAVSADVARVLFYPGAAGGGPVRVLRLADRALTTLTLAGADGPFAYGGWLPDGRVVLVGGSVWVGTVSTEPLRRVAERAGPAALWARLSPHGTAVAVAAADRVSVVDLRTGGVHTLATFAACAPGTGYGAGLAWSADDALLAWIDCPSLTVHVSDVATARDLRTIPGAARRVESLPTGDLIVTRDSGETGEGARSSGIVYAFDGTEKARYLGYAWSISADGRYLLDIGSCCAGYPTSTITDLRTPDAAPVRLLGIASWTADGRILVDGPGQ